MVLLPVYKSYRALIRGKVEALRAGPSVASVRYFTIAGRQTWSPYKPFVVVVCGLTGSGKSTLARELSERVGIVVINSDVVRKELTGKSGRGVPLTAESIALQSPKEPIEKCSPKPLEESRKVKA